MSTHVDGPMSINVKYMTSVAVALPTKGPGLLITSFSNVLASDLNSGNKHPVVPEYAGFEILVRPGVGRGPESPIGHLWLEGLTVSPISCRP